MSRTLNVYRLVAAATVAMFIAMPNADAQNSSTGGSSSQSQPTSTTAPDPFFDIDFSVSGVTDYRFRGVSQTDGRPAIQGTAEATAGIFYLGGFISNVDFGPGDPNIEFDVSGGIRPELYGINFDLGVIGYLYPNETSDTDYLEILAGASYDIQDLATVGANFYYAPDYVQSGAASYYTEGTLSVPLIYDISFDGSVGYYAFDEGFANDYLTWTVGATYKLSDNASFNVSYVDTDLGNDPFCAGTFKCSATVLGTFTVSTSFSDLRKKFMR